NAFTTTRSASAHRARYTAAALHLTRSPYTTLFRSTENPTVTVNIVDGALSDGDNNSVVTFTFSEAPVGFTAADITATHGTITGQAATAHVRTPATTSTPVAAFTGTGSVSVTADSYT